MDLENAAILWGDMRGAVALNRFSHISGKLVPDSLELAVDGVLVEQGAHESQTASGPVSGP